MLERLLRRGFRSRRGLYSLGGMENLARSGAAAWVIAQEKARLEYLAAKEDYEKRRTWRSFQRVLERLLQLHSTNALVQSLIQEQFLEQLVHRAKIAPDSPESPAPRRCA
jgi:hypothetical protein